MIIIRAFAAAPDKPKLSSPKPPATPPRTLGFGSSCFRATTNVLHPDKAGKLVAVGKVVGYDTSPAIAKAVEDACKHRFARGNEPLSHDEVVLFMLPSSDRPCSGEIFFEIGDYFERLN